MPLLKALQKERISCVIIGGCACALWAMRYETKKIAAFRPYMTKDLDLVAESKQAVVRTASALRVKAKLARKRAASNDLGILEYEAGGQKIFVQFLNASRAIRGHRILEVKQPYRWDKHDLTLEVMHPLHCLEDKIASLVAEPEQIDRQDKKHLKMALLFVPEFIMERASENERDALKMCQHIMDLAFSQNGLCCYRDHGIKIKPAIRSDRIATRDFKRLQNFLDKEAAHKAKDLAVLRRTRFPRKSLTS